MTEKNLNPSDAADLGRWHTRAREVRITSDGLITERESQLLALAEEGLLNGEIALKMGVEVRVIDNYVSNIRHKINQRGRALPTRDLLEWILRNQSKESKR